MKFSQLNQFLCWFEKYLCCVILTSKLQKLWKMSLIPIIAKVWPPRQPTTMSIFEVSRMIRVPLQRGYYRTRVANPNLLTLTYQHPLDILQTFYYCWELVMVKFWCCALYNLSLNQNLGFSRNSMQTWLIHEVQLSITRQSDEPESWDFHNLINFSCWFQKCINLWCKL